MKKFFALLTGIITGALVGAAVAILFAPSSGDELRATLEQRASQLKTDVSAAAEEKRIELEKQLKTLSQPVKETKES